MKSWPRHKWAAALVWGALLCLSGAVGGVLVEGQVMKWSMAATYLGVAGLFVALALAWDEVGSFAARKRVRYGGNNLVVVVSTFALVIAAYLVLSRHHIRWDFTETRQHSLSAQTIEILGSLDKEVRITIFYGNPGYRARLEDLLEEYEFRAKDGNLRVQFYDIFQESARARQFDVQEADVTVVECEGRTWNVPRREVVSTRFQGGRQSQEFRGEQAFTAAILKVLSTEVRKIYFTHRHGEMSLTQGGETSLSRFKDILERENFVVEELSLLSMKVPKIPEDCRLLVLGSPTEDFLKDEWTALRSYADKGGRLLIFTDPVRTIPKGLQDFLGAHGVELSPGMVLEPLNSHNFRGNLANPIPDYGSHKITENLRQANLATVLLGVHGLKKPAGDQSMTFSPLLEASAESWIEEDLEKLFSGEADPQYDEGEKKGPIVLGVALEPIIPAGDEDSEKERLRLVVFGDAEMVQNQYFAMVPGNLNLIMNAVTWLIGKEEGLSIRPKEPDIRRAALSGMQAALIYGVTLLLTPLVMVAFGLASWLRRRKL